MSIKRKIYFSLDNRNKETPATISFLQTKVKELSVLFCGLSFIMEKPDLTQYIMIGGFFFDSILQCFGYKEEN